MSLIPVPDKNVWKLRWFLAKWAKNSRGQINFYPYYFKKIIYNIFTFKKAQDEALGSSKCHDGLSITWGRTCWSLVEGSVEGKRIFMKTWWAVWALYLLKNSMSVCHHVRSTAWHRRPLVAKDTGVVLCLEDLSGRWDTTAARGQESLPESLPHCSGMKPGHFKDFKN